MDKTFKSGKKTVLFYILMVILGSFALFNTSVMGEQTVKTIDGTIGIVTQTIADNIYEKTINLNPPDGLDFIISAEIFVTGDFQADTDIYARINGYDCSPSSITTPNQDTANYKVIFDCSDLAFGKGKGEYDLQFLVDKVSKNTYAEYRITYYNNPKGTTEIFGTEYEINETGTVFLQLKDNQGLPINDGACILNIYYPNTVNQTHPLWLQNAPMLYLNNSAGLYYYDIVTPDITGIYMITATCTYTYQVFWIYPTGHSSAPVKEVIVGSFYGSDIVLNSPDDYLYTACQATGGATKQCWANYSWNISEFSINESNVTSIFYHFLGESSASPTVEMYAYNHSSNTWVLLPNTITMSGFGVGGSPTGINDYLANSIIDSPSDFINDSDINLSIRIYSGTVFDVYNNWIALSLQTETGEIIDVKGSGELHVADHWFNLSIDINNLANLTASEVWNYSTRTLTDYNLSEVIQLLNYINNTANNIYSFEINEIGNNLTEIKVYLEYINTTANNTYTYISGIVNLSASDVWNYVNRNLTYYEDTTDYGYIQALVWNNTNRTLTDFDFIVEINDTDILNAIGNLENLTASDVWNYVNRNLTFYQDVTDYFYIQNLTWNYSNRTLTDYNFTELLNYLNLINTSTYNLEPKIDFINWTTWQTWVLLQNISIGNITVSAYINLTELVEHVWNKTSQPKIQHDLLSLDDGVISTVVTTFSCLDNTTLLEEINSTKCILGNCAELSYNSTKICDYGCYQNECIPKPMDRTMIIAGIFLFGALMLIGVVVLYNKYAK